MRGETVELITRNVLGPALALGDFALAGRVLGRVAIDMVSVFLLVALIFLWKQKANHRCGPLP